MHVPVHHFTLQPKTIYYDFTQMVWPWSFWLIEFPSTHRISAIGMGSFEELLCVRYIVKVSTLVVIDSLGTLYIPDDARRKLLSRFSNVLVVSGAPCPAMLKEAIRDCDNGLQWMCWLWPVECLVSTRLEAQDVVKLQRT